MSETEDLKKGVMESKARQTVQEVNDYMDGLTANIVEAKRKKRISGFVHGVAWLVWIITAFFNDTITYYGLLLFTFTLMYDSARFTTLMSAYSEFSGAIRILELLGYLPPHQHDGERRKRRRVSEFVELVKGWAIKKKKAQDKVYAPA